LKLTSRSDDSPTLATALQIFVSRHPSTYTPTIADLHALRLISSHVAHRAAGVVAAGVHALWQLRNEAESIITEKSKHTLVAYNGSVMENYPGFEATCQRRLDGLVEASGGKAGVVELMYAEESSLLGAAVAVACLDG
jgi:hexokinase